MQMKGIYSVTNMKIENNLTFITVAFSIIIYRLFKSILQSTINYIKITLLVIQKILMFSLTFLVLIENKSY